MLAKLIRPVPPAHLLEISARHRFEPAPDLLEWLTATFIELSGTLYNEEHQHLEFASIGVLWTDAPNSRHGRAVVGQCEVGTPRAMGKWAKARAEQQVQDWFGRIPDFILTFAAPYAAECDDASFCALIEHELFHAAQERDAFGAPKFRKDGSPAFTIRGHDVEEFIGVVRRYGTDAAGIRELVDAANSKPEIGPASITWACGTCDKKAA